MRSSRIRLSCLIPQTLQLNLAKSMSVRRTAGHQRLIPKQARAFYVAEENAWVHLLSGLNVLHTQKGMNVILLSHVASKAYKDPELEPYDRWEMRCNKKVNSLIKDWVDFNLFANYETQLIKDGQKARGVS